MPDPCTIVIHPAPGLGFRVTVEPAPAWASFDTDRSSHRSALRCAQSLRTVHGWKIIDQSGGTA